MVLQHVAGAVKMPRRLYLLVPDGPGLTPSGARFSRDDIEAHRAELIAKAKTYQEGVRWHSAKVRIFEVIPEREYRRKSKMASGAVLESMNANDH